MKVAILGGAFNPPHWGHLSVARQILDFCQIDQVWLIPTYRYNPTYHKKLISFEHRLKMTSLLERTNIKVSDIEKNINGVTYTYRLIKLLQKKYKKIKFYFVIGSDNLADFTKWYRWQELLKLCSFLVFPREKIDPGSLLPNMRIVYSPLLKITPVSSTLVRNSMKNQDKIKQLMPDRIWKYIVKNRLYTDTV